MRDAFELESCLSINKMHSAFHYKGPWDYSFIGESHDFWEFVFVDKGQLLVTAGEERILLKAGEIIFHMPNEFHALSAYDNTMPNYIVISFETDSEQMKHFCNRIISLTDEQEECLHKIICYCEDAIGETDTPEQRLDAKKDSTSPVVRQLIKNKIEELLLSLIEQNNAFSIQSHSLTQIQRDDKVPMYKLIIDYVNEHICEQITLAELSHMVGFCITHMEKVFRLEMGCSIIQYINEQKMLKAKQMLETKKYTVKEVAINIGCCTPQYFARQFKKKFGMTPTECIDSKEDERK